MFKNFFFEMLIFGHIFNQKYFGTPKTIFRLFAKFNMVAMMTHLSKTKIQFFSSLVNILVSNQVLLHSMIWGTTTWPPKPNVCGGHHRKNGHFSKIAW